MVRSVFLFILIGALTTLVVWLINNTGYVNITLADYEISTSLSVIIIAIFILFLLVYFFWFFIRRIFYVAAKIKNSFLLKNKCLGYKSLISGLFLLEIQDDKQLINNIEKIKALFKGEELLSYFKARSYFLIGNDLKAETFYKKILNSDAKILALYGLFKLAVKKKDQQESLILSRKMLKICPSSFWCLDNLFYLLQDNNFLNEAEVVLKKMYKLNYITKSKMFQKNANLLCTFSKRLKDNYVKKKYLKRAYNLAPELSNVAINYAKCLKIIGEDKKVDKIIAKSWSISPNIDLYNFYLQLNKGVSPIQFVKKIQKLVSYTKDAYESHIVLSKAYLSAKLWGKAKDQLHTLKSNQLTSEVYEIFAELEVLEKKDYFAANNWLYKAIKINKT